MIEIEIYFHVKQILDLWIPMIGKKIHLNVTNHHHC